MALKFTTTSATAASPYVKAIVYGRAGAGKTMLAATAPSPIILSAESGLLSLAPANLKRVYGVEKDLPVITIESMREMMEAHKWLKESAHARQFETVYLDSLSELAEVVLTTAKEAVKDPRQAYGELLDLGVQLVRDFRSLNKHVIFACKEERFKSESTGTILAGPGMPGTKLGPALPYLVDEVFHLGVATANDKSTYRYLRTQPDLQNDAKDRSGALAVIEKPDLTHIINKIKNHG